MKPILPSRPNHSWLRRRLRDAILGVSSDGAYCGRPPRRSSGQANLCILSGQPTGTKMNKLDMQGRTAIVTGGAAGIGFAIAQRLAQSGARVSLWDRDERALAKARETIGETAHVAALDVTQENQVKDAF